jgi:hypothetical protein
MTYEYKIVYSILGGIVLTPELDSIQLYSDKTIEVDLLKNCDNFCKEIDISSALGLIYLRRRFINSGEKLNKKLIIQEVETIREKRIEKAQTNNFIAIKITKDYDLEISDIVYRDHSILFAIGENDNSILIESHLRDIDNILSSICISAKTSIQFEKLAEGIYFPNIDGKTLYRKRITFMRPKVFNANGITSFDVQRISKSITHLKKHKDLDKILRLHSQMHDKKNDEVKAFIFGWTSLEIFINKNFGKYYKNFWTKLNQEDPVLIRFAKHIDPVLKDRLRLNDKFLIIASCLNPDSGLLADLELFDKIKELRDKYFHGQTIDEFPIEDLEKLINKYLDLHIRIEK